MGLTLLRMRQGAVEESGYGLVQQTLQQNRYSVIQEGHASDPWAVSAEIR